MAVLQSERLENYVCKMKCKCCTISTNEAGFKVPLSVGSAVVARASQCWSDGRIPVEQSRYLPSLAPANQPLGACLLRAGRGIHVFCIFLTINTLALRQALSLSEMSRLAL